MMDVEGRLREAMRDDDLWSADAWKDPTRKVTSALRRRRQRRAAAIPAVLLLLAGIAYGAVRLAPSGTDTLISAGPGGSLPAGGLPAHEVLGAGTSATLTVDRASSTSRVKISEAVARQAVAHPFVAPALDGPVRQFGLARVTAKGGGLGAAGSSLPQYENRLAWVGIYEIAKNGPHSCPLQPQRFSASLPPVRDHYYFAVLVDASTGQQATWSENMSGLLLRQCAGISSNG